MQSFVSYFILSKKEIFISLFIQDYNSYYHVLQVKLELMTGGSCHTMQVEAYTKDNKFVCKLENNDSLLGSYPLDDGMRLHVIDQFQIRNELDFGNVPKYELSQEEYEQKSDSVRAFLQKNKLGKCLQ